MTTIAQRIIDFLGGLKHMDRVPAQQAVRDHAAAVTIEADPAHPEGAVLLVRRADGRCAYVPTAQAVNKVLTRHARAMAVANGGSVREQYQYAHDQFVRKTGFGGAN